MHFINAEDATCKVENVDCKVAVTVINHRIHVALRLLLSYLWAVVY